MSTIDETDPFPEEPADPEIVEPAPTVTPVDSTPANTGTTVVISNAWSSAAACSMSTVNGITTGNC